MPTWAISAARRSASPGSASSCPALVLNYFGQGALVLRDPDGARAPVLPPGPGLAALAADRARHLATIIASQAVISGVFSLTRQAIQLGHLSRMTIEHTSATEIGQIYIPRVNWLLMTGVLALVVGFGSSSNLAAAYGISVTGAMAIDAVLAGIVAAWRWGWGRARRRWSSAPCCVIDLAYFAANALKIPSGGWLPAGGGGRLRCSPWSPGAAAATCCASASTATAIRSRRSSPSSTRCCIARPGTAVFLTGNPHHRADGPAAQPAAQQGRPRARRAS